MDFIKLLKQSAVLWVVFYVLGVVSGMIPQISGFVLPLVNVATAIGSFVTLLIALLITDYLMEKVKWLK